MDVRQYEICKTYQLLFCDSGCVFNSWNLSWCLGHSFFYPGQWQDLNENRLALPLTEEETAADTDPYEVAPSVEAAAPGRHFVRILNMCWKRQILYGVPQWRPHGRSHINILG